MITDERDAELEYCVIVSAIVGGPFDVSKGQILKREELGEWEEPLLRRGAIRPCNKSEEDANLKPA